MVGFHNVFAYFYSQKFEGNESINSDTYFVETGGLTNTWRRVSSWNWGLLYMVRSKASLKKVADVADGYPANSHGWYTFDLYTFHPIKSGDWRFTFWDPGVFLKCTNLIGDEPASWGWTQDIAIWKRFHPWQGGMTWFLPSFWILSSP